MSKPLFLAAAAFVAHAAIAHADIATDHLLQDHYVGHPVRDFLTVNGEGVSTESAIGNDFEMTGYRIDWQRGECKVTLKTDLARVIYAGTSSGSCTEAGIR
jgi:hypothetical protein